MKIKSEASSFIFIASIAIGILISMNIGFQKLNPRVFLSAKQYQEAYNEKNKLSLELSNLIAQYKVKYSKLETYKYKSHSKEKLLDELKEEIFKNKMEIGKVSAKGPGVKITLTDANMKEFEGGNFEENRLKIVHNSDLVQVINELKNAGAEAISLNGQRIVLGSDIYCNGPLILINKVQIASPFEINAIGDPIVLSDYMERNDNYLQSLILRRVNVKMEELPEIFVPKFNGELSNKYLKTLD